MSSGTEIAVQPADFDVLIIGAGAAGLAALRELDGAGLNVLCVEARGRVGGRILTIHDPLCPLAIELGAEFIHGRPPEVWDIVHAAGLAAYDCGDSAVRLHDGEVWSDHAWDDVGQVMAGMRRAAQQGSDRTFAEFLAGADYPSQAKEWAASYVEGFNAARRGVIGIQSLAQDTGAADQIDGDSAFRLVNGYDAVPLHLLRSVRQPGEKLRLNSPVESVEWVAGAASVRVRHVFTGAVRTLTSRRVLITVPLGVLQADAGSPGAIRFAPQPVAALTAARALAFGQVMRVILRFRQPFWETKKQISFAGFLLSGEDLFPTWWTPLAVRAPIITGWSAGPKADALLNQPQQKIVGQALAALARITGTSANQVADLLEAAYFHDWHADPFARGSYSYVPAGGLAARAVLAQPVEDTLYFAGEATELNGHSATVHGAIASGRRAARQIFGSA